MEGIKDLLLNIFIVLTPIFIFQIFYFDKTKDISSWRSKIWFGICMSVSVILSMTFPFHVLNGYIYDLRTLPFLMGILYGGYRIGIMVSFSLYLCRYIVGGDGIWNVLIVYSLILIIAFYLIDYFRKWKEETKIIAATVLSTFTAILMLMNTHYRSGNLLLQESSPLLVYLILHTVGMAFTSYLMEKMKKESSMWDEYQQHKKSSVLSELATSVSNHIQGPLSMIRKIIENLKEKEIPPVQKEQYLHLMQEELYQLDSMVHHYLTFTQHQVEQKSTISVSERIRHVLSLMTPYAFSRGITMQEILVDSLTVYQNSAKFTQLLYHGVQSGVESMREGGVLRISVLPHAHEDMALIHLMDKGAGMTLEEIQQLKKGIFTSPKGNVHLFQCYRLVKELKGNIEIQSEKGKGTTVTISIPLHT